MEKESTGYGPKGDCDYFNGIRFRSLSKKEIDQLLENLRSFNSKNINHQEPQPSKIVLDNTNPKKKA